MGLALNQRCLADKIIFLGLQRHREADTGLEWIGGVVEFGSGKDQACVNALTSSQMIVNRLSQADSDISEPIDCAIGIAFGDVTYGNIGSRERLDFTVIGSAANIAARLGDFGKTAGHRIVATEDVAGADTGALSLGKIELHNVSAPVASFALSEQAASSS